MSARGALRFTLRARFLVLLGIVTVPALAMILLTAAGQRNATMRAVEADSLRVARLASREHAREISAGRELLASLGSIPGAAEDSAGKCPAFFSPLLRGFPHFANLGILTDTCLLYTSPSPRDRTRSRMPSSA